MSESDSLRAHSSFEVSKDESLCCFFSSHAVRSLSQAAVDQNSTPNPFRYRHDDKIARRTLTFSILIERLWWISLKIIWITRSSLTR